MNTPAHLIIGLAAFGKPGRPRVTAAALVGALIPDLSLYLLAGGALAWGIPAERVFGELYYSPEWQAVFAVDNSVFVWGLLLVLGLWRGLPWLIAGAGAGLLHLALDFPLHHDDGRAHFWPLTDWIFASPFSYWDGNHHAGWIAPLEVVLVVGLAALCWTRFRSVWLRGLLAGLVAAQLAVGGVWAYVFS
ncbi:cobalamin biosynthesis protein CobQ [Jannaschia sp. KMU-145]|uniref:cobalamin biosynthesis protein CobQ n=1 Tax=Jannaschia halovivens TaxID=3388667 RepID=UPI00396B3125